jgi:hypothetical protein
MAAITVAQLIAQLQNVKNQKALVTVTDAAGTNLVTVNKAGETSATPPADSPEAAAMAPGTIQLVGGA